MEKGGNEIQISVTDEILRGVYSNNILITHTKGEFLMDFMTIFHPKGLLGARVIVSPNHAKQFLKALEENISRYEQKFGSIQDAEPPKVEANVN